MRTQPKDTSAVWIGLVLVCACGGQQAPPTRDAGHEPDATPDGPTDPRPPFIIPDVAVDVRMGGPVSFCGDGTVDRNETCDDGNTESLDGCSADCQAVEPGWRCRVPGRRCTPICGDRTIEGTETCDDGNTSTGDGCSSYCLTEPGWTCAGETCFKLACPDRGAALLDGGLGAPDGCAPSPLWCGDGILSGAEECDLGAENADGVYGGCNTICFYDSLCGDGIVNGSEECDLGKDNGSSYGKGGCTLGCTNAPYCGDGIVDSTVGEECDFGEKNGRWLDWDLNPVDDGAPWTTKIVFCATDCSLPFCCGYH